MNDALPWSKRSLAAQALGRIDPITRAVVPPIHVATTYLRDEDNGYSSGYVYGRPDNATVREAEAVLAMLEEAPAGALLFSSGMAAATAVFQALDPGDHVVASKVMYWALRNWLATEATRWGLCGRLRRDATTSTRCAPRCGRAARSSSGSRRPRTRSGRSPTSRRRPRSPMPPGRGSRSIRPPPRRSIRARSTLGADIVMHAATKVLNGHSDVVAGALAGAQAGRLLGQGRHDPQGAGRHPRALRGLPPDPRPAHPAPARRRPGEERPRPRRAPRRASEGRARALSRPAAAPRPRPRRPPDGRRLRLHALDPGRRRRARRDRNAPPGSACGSAPPRSAASKA